MRRGTCGAPWLQSGLLSSGCQSKPFRFGPSFKAFFAALGMSSSSSNEIADVTTPTLPEWCESAESSPAVVDPIVDYDSDTSPPQTPKKSFRPPPESPDTSEEWNAF